MTARDPSITLHIAAFKGGVGRGRARGLFQTISDQKLLPFLSRLRFYL